MQNPSFAEKLKTSVSGVLPAFLGCVIFAIPVGAQDAALPPTVTQVKELLRANGTKDVGMTIGPIVAQQVLGILRAQGPPLSTDEQRAVSNSVMTYLRKRAAQDHLSDRFVPIYQKYFTSSEIRDLTRFYESPLGKKLVSTTPAISIATASVGQEWATSVLPGLQSAIASQLQAIQARRKPAPNPPPQH